MTRAARELFAKSKVQTHRIANKNSRSARKRQNKQVEIPNKFYLQDKEFGSQNVTNDAK